MIPYGRSAILAIALLASGTCYGQKIAITGGGATFPYPIYSKWFDEYHKKLPDISINYQSQGSGFGIQQVTAGTVDFGASDAPMNDQAIKDFRDKRGFNVLHFPTVAGADVPVYNLPAVSEQLNFTPEALAGIFLGHITKWNDPAIATANPGVKLPAASIVVVHRSDGSGTTYCWVDYLSKINKEWETKVGRGTSVNWPVGLGGKGNEAVSGTVKQQPNSLGYVELIYAVQNKMKYGKVKNSSGNFIDPTTESTAAAAAAVKAVPEDFRVSITNSPAKDAYPIATYTWLLVPEKIDDPAKRKAISDFLRWMITDGQKFVPALDYVQLTKTLADRELKAISKIH
jgi:phosphate transport system substrate-binding protein